MATLSWVDFWNRDTSIYVNARHKQLHYRAIARDIVGLIDRADLVVLDYGSGEALAADQIAARCRRLYLCDAAENTRARLAKQFGQNNKIDIIQPKDVEVMADQSLDLIIINSVLQYLDAATLDSILETLRDKLAPGGRLIIADIIPPDVSPMKDASALLHFGWQGGFLGAAFVGLLRTFFSDYRVLRQELGIATYTPEEVHALLQSHGLSARRLSRNLGHNPERMSFEAAVAR